MYKLFNKLSFSTRIFLGFGAVLSLTVLMSILANVQLYNLNEVNQTQREKWMPSIDTLTNLNECIDNYFIRELEHINSKDKKDKKRIQSQIDSLIQSLEENKQAYEKHLLVSNEEKKMYSKLKNVIRDFLRDVSATTLKLSWEGKRDSAMFLRRNKENMQILQELRSLNFNLIDLNMTGGVNATNQGDKIYNYAFWLLWVVLSSALLMGILISIFFYSHIMRQVGGEPSKIAFIANQVSQGNLQIPLENKAKLQGIFLSVKEIVTTLRDLIQITKIIAKGDTSKKLIEKSEKDQLASAINQMIDYFKEENKLKDGLNDLSKALSGNMQIQELSNKAISFLARFVEASQGVLYIWNTERQLLALLGTFAFVERNSLSNQYKMGEGIVGQVALEKKPILIKNVTAKEALITSGILQETPLNLMAFPLIYEDKLCGVIELASFTLFDELQQKFLDEASKIVATYIYTTEQNEKVRNLLELTEQAKKLAEQKTFEISEANAQLAQQQEELRAQAEELNDRTEELEKVNTEIEALNKGLEEKIIKRTQEISQQKEEIEAQRDSLIELNTQIETERQKANKLLLNILPEEVASELKEKGFATPKSYKRVSVLFTDFKGFTQLVEKITAFEVIELLDKCFNKFDEICERNNLEKIKTIGDSYMCAGGIPLENTTNPIDAVKAGLEIQSYMTAWQQERIAQGLPYFECRLGIHTGELVAGVVGKNKFAYDIWGDTVNLAARMESSGEVSKVNISGETYQLIKDKFQCTYRGKIQAKNKGEIEMYFVEDVL